MPTEHAAGPTDRNAWVRTELERRGREEGARAQPVAVLPPEAFSDAYADPDPRFPASGRAPDCEAIAGLLNRACCGWPQSPTAREFYEAMRTPVRTARQQAIVRVLIVDGTTDTVALGYLDGAYTWRQLAQAMHETNHYSAELADYVNRHAKPRVGHGNRAITPPRH